MKHKLATSRGLKSLLIIGSICLVIGLLSSAMAPGSHALAASAERLVVGGSDCGDFMNGIAIGMGVGTIFGCIWCAAGAVIAKGIGAFC